MPNGRLDSVVMLFIIIIMNSKTSSKVPRYLRFVINP